MGPFTHISPFPSLAKYFISGQSINLTAQLGSGDPTCPLKKLNKFLQQIECYIELTSLVVSWESHSTRTDTFSLTVPFSYLKLNEIINEREFRDDSLVERIVIYFVLKRKLFDKTSNIGFHTTQPKAHRMNSMTFALRGAEPHTMSRTFPPKPSLIALKTILSQIPLFLIIRFSTSFCLLAMAFLSSHSFTLFPFTFE